jgi:hypothetical protein
MNHSFALGAIAAARTLAAGGGSDPNIADVLVLLHFDGANGSQSIVNAISGGATPTVVGAGALSSAQARFGATSWKGVGSSYFEIALGTPGLFDEDFTLEWYGRDTSSGQVAFYSTTGGGYLYNEAFQDYGGPNLTLSVDSSGAWTHFAIVRQGSTMRAYKGGVQQGTATYSGTVDLRTTQWGLFAPNNNLHNTGYYDDLRLTSAVCRYPDGTTFTPSATAFPDA